MEDKQSPAEYMLSVLHNENASSDDKRWAAEKLAPYIHAKPAPAQRTVQIDLPAADTAEGVKAAFAKLIAATAAGELAPSEATALAGLIECQRKAIEMADVLGRLEELEEAQKGASRVGRRA
ncbi:hypothetical protein [Aureimonas psammosilenae]|uniref:hypothetical protein n=1 Tax=Aureimonas psammosilenae TaxID=2495496 RepID=UPI001260FBDC|nr:hypothetical protein [Aureimonas psammosilenae]